MHILQWLSPLNRHDRQPLTNGRGTSCPAGDRQLNDKGPGTHRSQRWLVRCAIAALLFGSPVSMPRQLVAEEPYRQFLEKLRDEKLFDLALVYLDDLSKNKQLDETFVAEMPLERAILLQRSAKAMGMRSPARATRQDEAEKAFQDFLGKNKQHPRRSEARMELGDLLLARAEESKADADPKAAHPEAAKFYGEAEQLFESTMKELEGILKEMQGARINPDDSEKIKLRDKYRREYRQAELLAAYATEQKGRSMAAGSAEWKKLLEKAMAAYTDFYSKEKAAVEARNYALFYRAGIHRDFGKLDDAVNGYQRILDETGYDELRPVQFKSLKPLVELLSSKEMNKGPAAIDLIGKWEKQIRPDERNTQDVIEFLMSAAKARLAVAGETQAKDDRNATKLRRDARESLQKLARINGPHQKEARQIMAELGMAKDKTAGPVTLPVVKSFEEANKEAAARIDQMQTDAIAEETLEQSLAAAKDDAEKKDISEQLSALRSSLEVTRSQASELLRIAIKLFPPNGDIADLNETRHRLAYAELQLEHSWEAIAIGEFLAHSNAGSESGLQSATIALAGYRQLINSTDEEGRKNLSLQLQPFAEFLVKTWPNAQETEIAASALIQMAMASGDVERARSYLGKLPSGTERADKLRREIGKVLADQYFQEKNKLADGTAASPELISKRDTAIEQLDLALKGIKKEAIDSSAVEGINYLVRLYLAAGKVNEATKWINDKDRAPLAVMKARPDVVSDRLVKLDTYRTALQAAVGTLGGKGAGKENDTLKNIESLIAELRTTAGDDKDGKQLLTLIFVKLAKDLQDLVEGSKDPQTRSKLVDGMAIICKQIADNSEEFSNKFWAAQTLYKVSQSLDNSAQQAKQTLNREAAKLTKTILEREAKSPGWIDVEGGETLARVTLAQTLRLAGEYDDAITQISAILRKNDAVLDMQVAAAEIYQSWGEAGQIDKFDMAINGAMKTDKGGKLIWGWGLMSQKLSKHKDFREQFFTSRFNLANCYYRWSLADAGRKNALLQKAEREIGSTRFLYPDLGSPENQKRFDQLMKNIQKELGKPQLGLSAFDKKADGS